MIKVSIALFFLSSHTHAHSLSLSLLWLVPTSSSTLFKARYSTLSHFSFFFFNYLRFRRPTLNGRQTTFESSFFFYCMAIHRNASVDNKMCPRDEIGSMTEIFWEANRDILRNRSVKWKIKDLWYQASVTPTIKGMREGYISSLKIFIQTYV